jgi:hypothetical protein
MQDHVKFFNPEHLYVFSRRYLAARLRKLGLSEIDAVPSELLVWQRGDILYPIYKFICRALWLLSSGRVLVTPSLLLIAGRHEPNEQARSAPSRARPGFY